MKYARATGVLPAQLGNAVSDAINAALRRGMEPDEALSVALQVVTDYWRHYYDNVADLVGLVQAAAELAPVGEDVSEGGAQ